MAYLLTTEAEIQQKSGANVNVAFNTTMMENAEKRAIAFINILNRYSWSDNLPTNADVKAFLSDIVSSLVAIEAISYDMSGYTDNIEAEDMVNILRDALLRNISILRDQDTEDYIIANAT